MQIHANIYCFEDLRIFTNIMNEFDCADSKVSNKVFCTTKISTHRFNYSRNGLTLLVLNIRTMMKLTWSIKLLGGTSKLVGRSQLTLMFTIQYYSNNLVLLILNSKKHATVCIHFMQKDWSINIYYITYYYLK